ncbi:lipocalin-like domain-containing protein [Methylobacterium iners]|uniref:Lipocalin-like domain-containing protein n=1 Tax=Methylobacterium iners TaxID=418707 RepID=A0ABQ4S5E4_9HYPH|nr:lipocalin-like domain-containing protein [Methylobacterium iners]GJD97094.1 hypothetical protein OCOJLMKI_4322 [Methylobacterium iners]
MSRSLAPTVAVSVALVCLASSNATAQTAKDLIGTWTLVSSIAQYGSTRVDTFGSNPSGTLVFGSDGRYALVFMRSGLPKIASNDRTLQTPHESRAIGQGVIAHFGTYTVDQADKVLVLHIERSSFPNWNGMEQRRTFSLTGDELTYTSPGSTGIVTRVTMRRPSTQQATLP